MRRSIPGRLDWLLWLAATALALAPAPAAAEDSNFRLIDTPKCTAQGLALELCFAANWGSAANNKAANAGVELSIYPSAPDPNDIRRRARKPFLITDVPAAGSLKVTVPFEALKGAGATAGKTLNITAHWASAQQGGAPASHVWGYTVHPVPVAIPQDFKAPEGAAQNASFRGMVPRRLFVRWAAPRWPRPRRR